MCSSNRKIHQAGSIETADEVAIRECRKPLHNASFDTLNDNLVDYLHTPQSPLDFFGELRF